MRIAAKDMFLYAQGISKGLELYHNIGGKLRCHEGGLFTFLVVEINLLVPQQGQIFFLSQEHMLQSPYLHLALTSSLHYTKRGPNQS